MGGIVEDHGRQIDSRLAPSLKQQAQQGTYFSTQPCGCDPGHRNGDVLGHYCSRYPQCAWGKAESDRMVGADSPYVGKIAEKTTQPSPYSDKSITVERHTATIPGIQDSGERQVFKSGAMRDPSTGKIKWSRITFGPMIHRWAQHLTIAEAKYPDPSPGVPNFTLIEGEEEFLRYKESAYRHFMSWFYGETDEDHAAAVFFNINGVEIIKDKMAGRPLRTWRRELDAPAP